MDWRHRAACRDEDPELFFPVGNSGPALLQIAEAKTVCRRCPVVSGCLSWALESGQDAGVWGGMSEDERRGLKRRNARTRARSTSAKQETSKKPMPQSQLEPGVIMAAPSSRAHSVYANRRRRVHVVGSGGRSACDKAFIDLTEAVAAADVSVEMRCAKTECRRAFAVAGGRPVESSVIPDPNAPVVAVAGESVLHEATSRWHPIDSDGLPACGVLVPQTLRKLAVKVEVGRRCRQVRCRRAWAKLDADLAVSHG